MRKKLLAGIMIAVMGLVMVAPMTMMAEPVQATGCWCKKGEAGKPEKKGVTIATGIFGGSDAYDENGKTISGVKCSCDDGDGKKIKGILSTVATVMTIGVGVLGVLGITIVGIQYLTAGGNEEKTRKAKRRMFEIIIGLVAYVLVYALLSFLIPEFKAFSW